MENATGVQLRYIFPRLRVGILQLGWGTLATATLTFVVNATA